MDRDLHERLILLEGDLPQREHSSYGDINALFNFYFTVEKKWLVKPQVLIRAAVEEEDAEEENEENVDAEEDEAGSIDSYGSPVIGTTAQEEDAEGDETGSVDSYRRLSTKEFLYPDFIICRFTPRRGQQILRFVVGVKPEGTPLKFGIWQISRYLRTVSNGLSVRHGLLDLTGILIIGIRVYFFRVDLSTGVVRRVRGLPGRGSWDTTMHDRALHNFFAECLNEYFDSSIFEQ